jgi:hypothetical protein
MLRVIYAYSQTKSLLRGLRKYRLQKTIYNIPNNMEYIMFVKACLNSPEGNDWFLKIAEACIKVLTEVVC